jgi:hypothetical protein
VAWGQHEQSTVESQLIDQSRQHFAKTIVDRLG